MDTPFAYLDPASGSMIIQIVLGGVAAAGVAAKLYWRRLLHVLHIRRERAEQAPDADVAGH
jgi:hypothetical protein